MGHVLGEHGLPEPLGGRQDDVLGAGEEPEPQHPLHGGPLHGLRPGPVEVGHGLEGPQAGLGEPALQAPLGPVLVLGADQLLEHLGGTPPVARRPGEDVGQLGGGAAEAEGPEAVSQRWGGRRRG